MSSSLLYELEAELGELEGELEAEQATGPLVRIHYVRGARREFEIEQFDPAPPRRGTILLTRFPFGGSVLSAAHRTILARIAAAVMARVPSLTAIQCVFLDVEGHEDEVGDPQNYGVVGAARARNAALALGTLLDQAIRKLPVANQRRVIITVSSAGPTRPIRSNVTADGRDLNRRVEIRARFQECPGITSV
jgi:outer membrane protein OmpA-like peptidoglycan-associated protein